MEINLPVYDHEVGMGPTLVFLHYWGGSGRTWDEVLGLLPGRDTLRIDFRGWGRSRALDGPFSLQRLADDVIAVFEDAAVSDYVLVGHSMGGKVAQLVASRRPGGLLGLVLVASAPAIPAAEITPEYQERLSHAYDSETSVEYARDNVLTATPLSEKARAEVQADSRSSRDGSRLEWPLRGISADISAAARAIDVPVLVVAGERDVVEPAAVLESKLLPFLSDARFAVIPRTGHLIPLEAPGELAEQIGSFLSLVAA